MTTGERFWELLEFERERVWQLSYALTGSYDEACDLASETFLAAYKSFPSMRDTVAFRKFLSTIAIRLHRRKRWRARIFSPLHEAEDSAYEMNGESLYDLDLLLSALKKLPALQRETIVLFEISGLSLLEIKEIQGGSISGIKSRLARARENLKRILTDENLQKKVVLVPDPALRDIPNSIRIQLS
ncbi:MAG: RNA polymerase sigma factor [Candidatus Kapaibacterium sp.]